MFVSTRASELKKSTNELHETIVYKHEKAKNTSKVNTGKTLNNIKENSEHNAKWNMKKLRYDIIKFGTSGFTGSQKNESKIALAVSLGAAPPKKKYINYKELLEIKRKEKESAKIKSKKDFGIAPRKQNKIKFQRKNKNEAKGLLRDYGKKLKTIN